MSGFLRRVAAIASAPRSNLHPLVGTLHATPSVERAAPAIPINHDRGQARDPVLRETSPLGAELPVSGRESVGPALDLGEARPTPLFARGPNETFQAMHPGVGPLEAPGFQARDEAAGETGTAPGPSLADLIQRLVADRSTPSSEPADGQNSVPGSSALPNIPAGLVPSRRFEPRLSAHPAPGEARQNDIQIHIGRIEVTALPQPVVRAPAQAHPRSMGLDEYLRRRDRGVG